MKNIHAYIIAAAAFFAFTPGLHAQVVTDKKVSGPNSNGQYTLTLESYVTGRVDEQETEKATDFVLALDLSGSMNTDVSKDPVFNAAVSKKTETSGARISETKNGKNSVYWTYSNTTANADGTADKQWFYKDGDTYYVVHKANNLGSGKNVRALYIVKSSKNYYLKPDGSGLTTTVPTSPTSNGGKLYTGTLYKGWSYATYKDGDGNTQYEGADDKKKHNWSYGITANSAGTANSQFYYQDVDGVLGTANAMYPVRKVNNLGTNGNVRALYIENSSGTRRYLRINGLSTSYDTSITTDYRTISMLPLYRGWTYNNITAALNDGSTVGDAGGHWVRYGKDALGNNAYYPLQKETTTIANQTYQVYFIDRNNVKRYLRAVTTTPSTARCAYSAGASVTLFFGNLYTVKEWTDYNRFEGLRRAVAAFAEGVHKHANDRNKNPNGLSHRIAVIGWGSPRWITTLDVPASGTYKDYHHPASNTSNTEWSTTKKIPSKARNVTLPYLRPLSPKVTWNPALHGKADTDVRTTARGARVILSFRNMLNTTEGTNVDRGDKSLAAINAEFDEQPKVLQEATNIEFGVGLAQALFDREWRGGNNESAKKDFDGSGTWDSWEKSSLSANYSKKADYKRPKTLIIVSDGGFNGYDWTNFETAGASTEIGSASINRAKDIATAMKNDGIKIYCIHVNSNGINNNEKAIATSADYCIKANSYGKELIDAMLTIVNKIDVADINLTSQAVVQDIVTKEFTVPGGTSTSNIKLYTAPCTGESNGVLTFGSKSSFSGTITKTVNEDGTTSITVTGFNYADNWCGKHSTGSYSGKKLIIEIPIVPDPDIIGGTYPTNTSQSIILDKPGGTKVAEFPIPSIPFDSINLRIVKKGLQKGDSAVFQLFRKPKTGTSPKWETTPFMHVLLTGVASGDAEAQIVGLNVNYYYKIVETGWSWLYTPDVVEISTETQAENPFVFTNTMREDTVPKNGEDVVHNTFNL